MSNNPYAAFQTNDDSDEEGAYIKPEEKHKRSTPIVIQHISNAKISKSSKKSLPPPPKLLRFLNLRPTCHRSWKRKSYTLGKIESRGQRNSAKATPSIVKVELAESIICVYSVIDQGKKEEVEEILETKRIYNILRNTSKKVKKYQPLRSKSRRNPSSHKESLSKSIIEQRVSTSLTMLRRRLPLRKAKSTPSGSRKRSWQSSKPRKIRKTKRDLQSKLSKLVK